jgi:hypothetical protein
MASHLPQHAPPGNKSKSYKMPTPEESAFLQLCIPASVGSMRPNSRVPPATRLCDANRPRERVYFIILHLLQLKRVLSPCPAPANTHI